MTTSDTTALRFKTRCFSVDRDGHVIDGHEVDVTYDSRLNEFQIGLPEYMGDITGKPHQLFSETLLGVITDYEVAATVYQRMVLKEKPVKMLAVSAFHRHPMSGHATPFYEVTVHDGWVIESNGTIGKMRTDGLTLLLDTEENRAKLTRIYDSFRTAALILDGLHQTEAGFQQEYLDAIQEPLGTQAPATAAPSEDDDL